MNEKWEEKKTKQYVENETRPNRPFFSTFATYEHFFNKKSKIGQVSKKEESGDCFMGHNSTWATNIIFVTKLG